MIVRTILLAAPLSEQCFNRLFPMTTKGSLALTYDAAADQIPGREPQFFIPCDNANIVERQLPTMPAPCWERGLAPPFHFCIPSAFD